MLNLSALWFASCLDIVNLLYSLLQSLFVLLIDVESSIVKLLMTKGLHGQAQSCNPLVLL